MNTTPDLHYQNANFLRELAEKLPRISPEDGRPEHMRLLQKLADEQLAEAQHIDWVRAKVAAARDDTRPDVPVEEAMMEFRLRMERLHNGNL